MRIKLNTKKMAFTRKIATIVVFCAVIVGCIPPPEKSHLQQIQERGTMRFGTLYGASSYYVGPDGPVGFEYELALGFAEYLGVELDLRPNYSLTELFPLIDSQDVDVLGAGLTITPERKEQYRFSPSYQEVSQKLVFKQGRKRPRSPEQLTGKLLVAKASSHEEVLRNIQSDFPNLEWSSEDADSDELLLKVYNNEIDYTISDSNTLAINRRYYPDISIGFTIAPAQPVAWVLEDSSDDSLYSAVIEYFGQIHSDGTLIALVEKYFGHITQFNYVDTREFIRATESKLPEFKPLFQKHAGELDWRLLAAISYQESHWDPLARSQTGVRGLMMLTLPTARQMGVTSRLDPEQSVRGGAKYFQQLLKRIPDRIKYPDRLWFTLGSYNIGRGHIEDARIITQRQGGDPDKWLDVKKRLPLLRQKKYYKKTKYGYARGDEPVRYVDHIRRYLDTLIWLDEEAKKQQTQQQLLESLQTSGDDSSDTDERDESEPLDKDAVESSATSSGEKTADTEEQSTQKGENDNKN